MRGRGAALRATISAGPMLGAFRLASAGTTSTLEKQGYRSGRLLAPVVVVGHPGFLPQGG
jgi:hypothetical protein